MPYPLFPRPILAFRGSNVLHADSWRACRPNEASVPGRDFKKLNRLALVHGSGTNTAQIAEFRRHNDARLKGAQTRQQVCLPLSLPPRHRPHVNRATDFV